MCNIKLSVNSRLYQYFLGLFYVLIVLFVAVSDAAGEVRSEIEKRRACSFELFDCRRDTVETRRNCGINCREETENFIACVTECNSVNKSILAQCGTELEACLSVDGAAGVKIRFEALRSDFLAATKPPPGQELSERDNRVRNAIVASMDDVLFRAQQEIDGMTPGPPAGLCTTPREIKLAPKPRTLGNGLVYDSLFALGLARDEFQSIIGFLARRGSRPVQIGGDPLNDDINIVFNADDDSNLLYETDLDGRGKTFRDRVSAGWRAVSVQDRVLFDFIFPQPTTSIITWVQDTSPYDWDFLPGLDEGELLDELDRRRVDGFRPISVGAAGIPTRFSAIVTRENIDVEDPINWTILTGIELNDLQQAVDDLGNMVPYYVSAYEAENTSKYVILAYKPVGRVEFRLLVGSDAALFASFADPSNRNQGFHLATMAVDPNTDKVTAVWHRQGRTTRITGTVKDSETAAKYASLEARILADMADRVTTGGAYAIMEDGEIVVSKGLTVAPAEHQTIQPRTQFRIGSISKPITATAALQALEAADLNVNAKIFKTTNLVIFPPPELEPITYRDTLQHFAGWYKGNDSVFDNLNVAENDGITLPVTSRRLFDYFLTLDNNGLVSATPSRKFRYSNPGYVVLERAINDLVPGTYTEFVTTNIVQPLGMCDTSPIGTSVRHNIPFAEAPYSMKPKTLKGDELTERRKVGLYLTDISSQSNLTHTNRTKSSRLANPARFDDSALAPDDPAPSSASFGIYGGRYLLDAVHGPGGWVSTAPDLVRFMNDFVPFLKSGKAPGVFSLKAAQMMFTTLNTGINGLQRSYGLGWFKSAKGNLWHGGDTAGSVAVLMYHKKADVVVALTLNRASRSSTNWASLLEDELDAVARGGGGLLKTISLMDGLPDEPVQILFDLPVTEFE